MKLVALAPHQALLAVGVLADGMLVLPLLFLLYHRGQPRSPWRLLRIAALGVGATWLIVPHGSLPSLTPLKLVFSGIVMLGETSLLLLIGALLWQHRRKPRASPEATLRQLLAQTLGDGPLVRLAGTELLIWYYALFSWRRQQATVSDGEAFSYGQRDGSANMLLVFAWLNWLEPPFLHLLIRIWSPTAAWVFTGLSVYGFFWLLGEYRATCLRPITLDAQTLHLRRGLALGGGDLDLPREQIARVSPHRGAVDRHAPGVSAQLGLMGEANICIELSQPQHRRTLLGRHKTITHLYLGLDEPQRFIAALSQSPTSE